MMIPCGSGFVSKGGIPYISTVRVVIMTMVTMVVMIMKMMTMMKTLTIMTAFVLVKNLDALVKNRRGMLRSSSCHNLAAPGLEQGELYHIKSSHYPHKSTSQHYVFKRIHSLPLTPGQ